MGMPEPGREAGNTALDIDAVPIPPQQRVDGEPVSQVMEAGTVAVGFGGLPQAGSAGQLDERPARRPFRDAGAAFAQEKPGSRGLGQRRSRRAA